jgi:hypothetical protein
MSRHPFDTTSCGETGEWCGAVVAATATKQSGCERFAVLLGCVTTSMQMKEYQILSFFLKYLPQ